MQKSSIKIKIKTLGGYREWRVYCDNAKQERELSTSLATIKHLEPELERVGGYHTAKQFINILDTELVNGLHPDDIPF